MGGLEDGSRRVRGEFDEAARNDRGGFEEGSRGVRRKLDGDGWGRGRGVIEGDSRCRW